MKKKITIGVIVGLLVGIGLTLGGLWAYNELFKTNEAIEEKEEATEDNLKVNDELLSYFTMTFGELEKKYGDIKEVDTPRGGISIRFSNSDLVFSFAMIDDGSGIMPELPDKSQTPVNIIGELSDLIINLDGDITNKQFEELIPGAPTMTIDEEYWHGDAIIHAQYKGFYLTIRQDPPVEPIKATAWVMIMLAKGYQ